MKRKTITKVVTGLIALFSLGALNGCGSNDYIKGEFCGNATAEGTNAFSEIRRVYCEEYVYKYNESSVSETGTYAAYANHYTEKFNLVSDELVLVGKDTSEYISAHYIFTFYDKTNDTKKNAVVNYVNKNVSEPETYLTLVNEMAYGTDLAPYNGYFNKINSMDHDEDTLPNDSSYSVKNKMTKHSKACLVFQEGFIDPSTGVSVPKSTWKEIWQIGGLKGFFSAIFVYPLGWLVDVFVGWFGGSGWAQIFAILLITIILKIAIFGLTFKSQSSTQKMQDIQPEILKVQSKYGPNPTGEDKQRMSMELMQVYQKYGVKPLAPFTSLLITFPVFIAMYRAIAYLSVLRTGNVGGVILGETLSNYIIQKGNFNFVAVIVFILMAGTQILSMKLPQLLNAKRLTPEAKAQQKQTNMMTNMFMIMILVMGFMMPVVMSIYWIASAIVAIAQSLIMHKLNNSSKTGRYKVKKVESTVTIPQGYKKEDK